MATKKTALAKPKTENKLAQYGVTETHLTTLVEDKTEGLKLQVMLANVSVKTPEQYAAMSARLTPVLEVIKRIDDRRTAITKPLLAAKKSVDDLFNPALKPFKACEEIIRAKLKQYVITSALAERALLAQAEKAAEAGDVEGATAAIEKLPEVVEATGNTSKVTWKVKRVHSIEYVPMHYLQLNDSAVKAFIDAHVKTGSTEAPIIQGIEFELDADIRARGNRS